MKKQFGEKLLSLAIFLLFGAGAAQAATFTVTNTNNSGAGSLRQAIIDSGAAGSDTIVFDPAVFSTPQTITLASTLNINTPAADSLTINGPGATLLTLDGNNTVHLITNNSVGVNFGSLSISGMTLIRSTGGAITNNAPLTVTNVAFVSNTNSFGGAINNSATLTITGCSFTNNIANGGGATGNGGGAIYNSTDAATETVTITDSTFTGNAQTVASANSGGAIRNRFGAITVTNSTFTNNTAAGNGGGGAISTGEVMSISGSAFTGNSTTAASANGGGISNSGQLTITNTVVTGNSTAESGGGIASFIQNSSITMTITNSTVSNNTANSDSNTGGDGGGLFLAGTGSVSITGSTINGNTVNAGATGTAGDGGGIDVSQPLTLTNSTVSGNTAGRNGGGIYASGVGTAIVNIYSSTIVNNTAAVDGGGVVRASSSNPVNFRNTIVANNTDDGTAPDVLGSVVSQGYNLIKSTTGATITGDTATNIIGQDPNLGPLQNNGGLTFTHALLTGSPAIDKGESSGIVTDQRGQTRPVDKPSIPNAAGGDGADIGAFEDQPIVMFSAADYTVSEPNLTATITVLRSGGTNGVDTVQYSTTAPAPGMPPATGGANCTDGVDFINTSGTLTFAESVASQTFTVTICNDTLVETDEFVVLELSNPSGKTLGTPSSAVLRIVSEDVFIPQKPFADFDGDGKTDLAVFRPNTDPSVFDFAIRRSSDNSLIGYSWGLPGDKLAPGDYDGDGKTDVAVCREGAQNIFYIIRSSDGAVVQSNFGINGDILTVGDWDGDGKSDEAVYRESAQSYFYYRGSLNNPNRDITYLPWGTTGDKPVRGDFDGDGKQDAAVFRPSNNTWYIRNSSNGQARFENWGIASDKFVPADYDGDGKTDLAVFRNGVWYIKQSITNQPRYVTFGLASDTLVPADYDGDGRTDIAVFRNGAWYLMQSANGFAGQTFGTGGDIPVPSAYINP